MSTTCYCGRPDCSVLGFARDDCLVALRAQLAAERTAHDATKAKLREVMEQERGEALSVIWHKSNKFDPSRSLCDMALDVWVNHLDASFNKGEVTCVKCRAIMEGEPRAPGAGVVSGNAPSSREGAKADPVSSPTHYRAGAVECIDAIDAALAGVKDPLSGFYVAQVIKYVWRHEQKGKPVEDLKKAKWYLDRLIKRLT